MTRGAGITPSRVKCIDCGYDLTGATIGGVCPECGAPVDKSLQTRLPASGTAVTALVLGIASLGCGFCGPLAIIAYCMAMSDIRRGQ